MISGESRQTLTEEHGDNDAPTDLSSTLPKPGTITVRTIYNLQWR